MNDTDKKLLTALQDFLHERILHDATAAAHHEDATKLYEKLHVRVTRPRPHYAHFLTWRASSENSVRENPKAEVMVYCGLFPGRVHDLLLELTT